MTEQLLNKVEYIVAMFPFGTIVSKDVRHESSVCGKNLKIACEKFILNGRKRWFITLYSTSVY